MPEVLSETQLREIEASHPQGLSSADLVAAFVDRSVRFSEATLRKYVQLGLVPRSRRVGRKGKHLGSRGMYPVRSIRRINTIKRLMGEHYTVEEIQNKFLVFKDSIETLDEVLGDLVQAFEDRIVDEPPSERRERLREELSALKANAARLLDSVLRLEKLVVAAAERVRPRGGGAAGATELL